MTTQQTRLVSVAVLLALCAPAVTVANASTAYGQHGKGHNHPQGHFNVPISNGHSSRGDAGSNIGANFAGAIRDVVVDNKHHLEQRSAYVQDFLNKHQRPGLNIVICHTRHLVYGNNYKQEHLEMKEEDWSDFYHQFMPADTTTGYDVFYIPQGAWFDFFNLGDGGWINWGYSGNFVVDPHNPKHITTAGTKRPAGWAPPPPPPREPRRPGRVPLME